METTPNIQELAIVLAISNHNPTLLTPDFLAGSGIVPLNWELSRPPVFSAQASQVAFTNGISIVAQLGSVTFSESITNKPLEEVALASLASKYASALPNLDYRAVGISPKRFVTFEHQPDAAHTFITNTLLSPGSWQNAGTASLQANITLAYTFDQHQLRLNIAEARLQAADKEPIPIILFAGSFHYDLDGELGQARLTNLHKAIEHWRTDLETYQNLIDTQFLPLMETDQATMLKAVG
jgi:hypothetical protein